MCKLFDFLKICIFGALLAFVQTSPINAGDNRQHTLQDLAFIAGTWEGTLFGAPATEHWLPPSEESMIGMFQLYFPNGKSVIEFFMMEQTDEGIFMRWNHYNPDYTVQEDGPIILKLSKLDGQKAIFDMLEKDAELPDRFVFERLDDEHLNILLANVDANGNIKEEGGILAEYTLKK